MAGRAASGQQRRRERRVTIDDVASHAGVSRALVSIVLRDVPGASPQNRRRVLDAAAALGYRPDARAQRLRQKRAGMLGVTFAVRQPFHCDLVEAIYRAAAAQGCEVMLSAVTPDRHDAHAVDTLLADRCDAAILIAPRLPVEAIRDLAARLPTVVIGPDDGVADAADVIRQDNTMGMRLAVEHLASFGHHHLAHVDGGDDILTARLRRDGFLAAVAADPRISESWVLPGGPAEDHGAHAAAELLRGHPATAVVTFNDRVALGLRDAFLQAGRRIPTDMSLVGYDDSRPARAEHISLTTIAQPTEDLARLATDRAVARLSGSTQPNELITVSPTLVVRGTTAQPRHGGPAAEITARP